MSEDEDDVERCGQIIPPSRGAALSRYDERRALERDRRTLHPESGLASLVETLRQRSATRLMSARTDHVEAWTRFLYALDHLSNALMDREKKIRKFGNLDAILDAEEAYENELTMLERKFRLAEARKRLRDAERALAPEKEEKPEPKEPKEEKKKVSDPVDRIVEGFENRQYLKQKRDELIKRVLDTAQAQGISPDEDDIRREIENIKSDFNKAISETYGR